MPELKVPEGDSLPTACLTCALYGSNPGFESVRRVTLDFGVRPPKICTTSIRHLPTRIFFHHQGWLQLQCPLEQLCLLGYVAEVATDGVEALKMWRSGRYGMLLTDCHMPNMDGFELTRAIRNAEVDGAHLPIIAVTANAMQGEAQHCRSCGMDDYLSKPLRLDELGRMLSKWLKRSGEDNLTLAAPASIMSQQVIWDPLMLTRMVGAQPEMHRRYLEKFLLSAETQLAHIRSAVAAGNTTIVADVAHQLKSSSRTVGAQCLGELCQEIEVAGRAADQQACDVLVDRINQGFLDAAQKIRGSFTHTG